jgi:hypothetical protein
MNEPTKATIQDIQALLTTLSLELDISIPYIPEEHRAAASAVVEKARAMSEALMSVESIRREHPEEEKERKVRVVDYAAVKEGVEKLFGPKSQ